MSGRWASCRLAFLLFYFLLAAAVDEDDVRCLRGLKDALGDPDGRLSWNFANASVGFVCNFVGVTCWNPQENRVITLSLPSMSLAGSVPSALRFCRAATTLDLSGNSLTGSIPSDLCDWLPFLVNLDLSGNSLSGPIPPELSNCRFLNSLQLSSNSLSGQIPASLSRLDRLKHLDLSRNRLSGEVPQSLASSFPSSSVFESNAGLCGRPVSSRCGSRSINRTGLIIVISAGIFGAAASLLIAYAIWRFCLSADSNKRMKNGGGGGVQCWAKRLRASHARLVQVQLFQKPIVKLKLSDLMAVTGDFHPDHIVAAGSSRAGTSYKAVLPDGSALIVKRLHGCPIGEKQFRAEMGRLGQLRHPNLAPLLGFCIADDVFLLIYKHMANGDLSSHLATSTSTLHWPARLRIAVSAARGLAWLHHGFHTPLPHLHISSSTILLDEECEARITDFGMPGLIASQPPDAPGTSLFLKGNFGELGYLPPEHAGNPAAAVKADVFAFGVVLLELATGQKPTEVVSSAAAGEEFNGVLVDWINQLSVTNRLLDSLDNFLRGKGDDAEILEFLSIALSCVAVRPKERPSMHHVYQSLKNIGSGHDFSEQFDEFPLLYGKDDPESVRGEV